MALLKSMSFNSDLADKEWVWAFFYDAENVPNLDCAIELLNEIYAGRITAKNLEHFSLAKYNSKVLKLRQLTKSKQDAKLLSSPRDDENNEEEYVEKAMTLAREKEPLYTDPFEVVDQKDAYERAVDEINNSEDFIKDNYNIDDFWGCLEKALDGVMVPKVHMQDSEKESIALLKKMVKKSDRMAELVRTLLENKSAAEMSLV